MTAEPLVSVIMPYYDRPDYLVEAVASVRAQTYKNWELIIADDASPLPTAEEILRDVKEPNIKIIRHESNMGLAETRNTAIRHSSGPLICPLDCDDKLDPAYLATTTEALMKREVSGIYTQVQIFGDLNMVWTPDCSLLNMMCAIPGPSTFLYKREVFDGAGGYTRGFYHADSDFWLRALSKGYRFERIDKPLYLYRKHDKGMTATARCEEVPSLARAHKSLYCDNLEDVLRREEEKYWEAKDEYKKLEEGFNNVMGHYQQLEKNHEELLSNFRELERTHYVRRLLNFLQRRGGLAKQPESH